ncbi:MAG: DMT family transporter, partial [Oscillospiraceae bacterium]|nr:DMT family transporter [Oscillospiraceae bacterium]
LGLFEPVIYFVCENYGILYTSATFSGMMIAMIPISSMVCAALFLRERPSPLQVLFSVISVSGVVMVSVRGTGGEGAVPVKGVLLMLCAVLSASGYQLMSRKLSGEFTAFERTVFMFLEGAVVYVGLMLLENAREPMAMLKPLMNWRYVVALLFQGTLSSVGAYFFQNYAMTYLPINRVAPFANMTTAVSLFAGVVFLHEPFGLVMIPASLMILGGVWGVQRFARKEE